MVFQYAVVKKAWLDIHYHARSLNYISRNNKPAFLSDDKHGFLWTLGQQILNGGDENGSD